MTPGLVIAAPRSGSGKTTLTLGLLRAYRRLGLDVVGVKSGPDYIDPAFHAAASGRDGLNLDSWAMPPSLVLALAGARGAGPRSLPVRSLDGPVRRRAGGAGTIGRLGRCRRDARRAGPACRSMSPARRNRRRRSSRAAPPTIRASPSPASILNRVGSARHRRLAGDAIEALGVPVVGSLPRLDDMALPERHLGLVQAMETHDLEARLDRIGEAVAAHVDLTALRGLARPLRIADEVRRAGGAVAAGTAHRDRARRGFLVPLSASAFGLARQRRRSAFLFSARRRGAADALRFLLAARRLSRASCRADRRRREFPRAACGASPTSRPVHGECGGYMVLGAALTDASGAVHRMAGLLGVETSFAKRRMNLGYRDATLIAACGLGAAGRKFKGHEFHYSTLTTTGGDEPFADVSDAYGAAPTPSGSRRGARDGELLSYYRGGVGQRLLLVIAAVEMPNARLARSSALFLDARQRRRRRMASVEILTWMIAGFFAARAAAKAAGKSSVFSTATPKPPKARA